MRWLTLALLACGATEGPDDTGAPPVTAGCAAPLGDLPAPLDLPATDRPNGVFDPAFATDPETSTIWASFSGVDGPAGEGRISTHLASSEDGGRTWCHAGVLNPAETAVDLPDGIERAFWSNEVSTIVHDPAAAPDEAWRVVWHRYLHDEDGAGDGRRFEFGWLATRAAATPEGLFDAPVRKLVAGQGYVAQAAFDDRQPGGEPVVVRPDCLLLTEPGLGVADGRLFLVATCAASATEQTVERLEYDQSEWRSVGTLLDSADARAVHPDVQALTAADVSTGDRLLVSPSAGGAYRGCIAYALDLSTGAVGDPVWSRAATEGADVVQTGACGHHPALGVVVGDTHLSAPQFRLTATGEAP